MEDILHNLLNVFSCVGFSVVGGVVILGSWYQLQKKLKQQPKSEEKEKVTKIIW